MNVFFIILTGGSLAFIIYSEWSRKTMSKEFVDNFIRNYQYLKYEILYLSEKIEELEVLKTTPKTSKIGLNFESRAAGGNNTSATFELIVERVETLQNKLNKDKNNLLDIIEEFNEKIQVLENLERQVLREKIIENKTFLQISKDLYISERTVYRKYSKAINKLYGEK